MFLSSKGHVNSINTTSILTLYCTISELANSDDVDPSRITIFTFMGLLAKLILCLMGLPYTTKLSRFVRLDCNLAQTRTICDCDFNFSFLPAYLS